MSNKIFRRASWLTPSCFLTVAGRYLLETHKVSLKAPAQFLFKPLLVRQSVSKKGLRWPKMFVRNVHSAPAPHSLEVLQPPLKTQGLSLFPQVLGSGTVSSGSQTPIRREVRDQRIRKQITLLPCGRKEGPLPEGGNQQTLNGRKSKEKEAEKHWDLRRLSVGTDVSARLCSEWKTVQNSEF